ncbi:hypothetical protein [Pseudoclavibacter sp. VKM Ac-2888]|uniref:hypothetical protein n=1 Tax=Pseudoclavibacter sp. VKM Ac-2888 TaxID=2783830 RepID=UPI00188C75C4|nr:hypothetical protein [Pseudoclavibacter sp. VKM Ac-2888]MBF4548842.1 hypothetical protein [Pseudoclavibacter sp. VKM Ac-2888]
MTSIYVNRQRSIEADPQARKALETLFRRMLKFGADSAPGLERVPGATDSRARLVALDGGYSALVFVLEVSPASSAAVIAGIWPAVIAREKARTLVLQLNPVNGLPELEQAASPEAAIERRAEMQRMMRSNAERCSEHFAPLSEEEQSEPGNAPELTDKSEASDDADAQWRAATERVMVEAAAKGDPIDEALGEWIGSRTQSGEVTAVFVTFEQMRAFEQGQQDQNVDGFEGIHGRFPPMDVERRIGLPRELFARAWDARTQSAFDAVVDSCENEWQRLVLTRMLVQPTVDDVLAEFSLEIQVVPSDPEPTAEQWDSYERDVEATRDRWDAGQFVDEPEVPEPPYLVELSLPASDAEIIASFEHPTARLQFQRSRS